MSSRACRYLIAPLLALATLNARSSPSVATGADAPSELRNALKSRLKPYLRTTEQAASLAFVCSRAAQMPQALRAAKLGTVAIATVAPAAVMSAAAALMAACVAAFDVS